MFFHNFKYSLKTLFQNKVLIFWTFAFPLILGTLFHLAFQNIESNETLKTIPIAIVGDHSNQLEVLNMVPNGDEKLFSISNTTLEEAVQLLEKDKISGYLLVTDSIELVIKENGIDQTILKYILEEVLETKTVMNYFLEYGQLDPSFIASFYELLETIKKEGAVEIEDISNSHLSYTMIEFYTLIAMTCLYGGMLGLYVINQNLANQSSNGKRIAVSPTPERVIIFSSALAGYVAQLIGIALLFFYTIVFLHVDYGTHFFYVLLLTFIGCLAGLSLGIMVASVFKTNENGKIGIMIATTMFGCFLSGMMGITMKYVIDKNIPILNLVNPANMITDGLYSLYYYNTFTRYYMNVASLCIFSALMILISIRTLRRQQYDSI